MVKSKEIVIDGKGHLVGRLAAIVAKHLLEGHRITVLRCEDLDMSGKLFRNKLKYMEFLRKKSNTNPRKHSHKHYRRPSMIFWRVVRGMTQHKRGRGARALANLKTSEGVPEQYHKKKRMAVPEAQTCICIKPDMAVTRLGDLASHVGWKRDAIVKLLEEKRKAQSAAQWEQRKNAAAEYEAKKKAALEGAPQDVKDALQLICM